MNNTRSAHSSTKLSIITLSRAALSALAKTSATLGLQSRQWPVIRCTPQSVPGLNSLSYDRGLPQVCNWAVISLLPSLYTGTHNIGNTHRTAPHANAMGAPLASPTLRSMLEFQHTLRACCSSCLRLAVSGCAAAAVTAPHVCSS